MAEDEKAAEKRRLADALRANLKRRKAGRSRPPRTAGEHAATPAEPGNGD